jgi:hypothetical protein
MESAWDMGIGAFYCLFTGMISGDTLLAYMINVQKV